MSLTNKILIGFILVLGLVFFYTAARTLQTHSAWRSAVNDLEKRLEAADTQREQLLHGSPSTPGIQQRRNELDHVTLGRGHVWYNAVPGQIDPANGVVTLTIESQAPHQLTQNTLVYVFGDREKGGGYLGEFRATAVADKQVTLKPANRFAPSELDRLQKSPGPWTLYDTMLADNHEAFAGLDDEQRKTLPPEVNTDEYRKDGQPADPNDPQDRVVDGKYVRQLRDYLAAFHEFYRLRTIHLDWIAAQQKDKDYMTAGLERANQTIQLRAKQIDETKQQLARLTEERNAVVAHREKLADQLADVRKSIGELSEQNAQLASRLARWQSNALSRANQRTAAAVTP